MPASTKAQFRFMKAAEHGDVKGTDLSPEKAKEYTKANLGKLRYGKLPEKKSK